MAARLVVVVVVVAVAVFSSPQLLRPHRSQDHRHPSIHPSIHHIAGAGVVAWPSHVGIHPIHVVAWPQSQWHPSHRGCGCGCITSITSRVWVRVVVRIGRPAAVQTRARRRAAMAVRSGLRCRLAMGLWGMGTCMWMGRTSVVCYAVMLCCVVLCYALLCCAVVCCAVLLLCCAVVCCAVVLCCRVLCCCTVLFLCCAVLCCAVLFCSVV